jgi:hypothetical protein
MSQEDLKNILISDLIPEIQRRRVLLHDQDANALVVCDSHSSRINPRLWKKLLENRIYLLTFPSHTSHLMQVLSIIFLFFFESSSFLFFFNIFFHVFFFLFRQPCDLGPNGVIKAALRHLYIPPTQAEIHFHRNALADCLREAVHRGLAPMINERAFFKVGLYPFSEAIVTKDLVERREGIEEYWKKKEERVGRIDNRMLTSAEVIEEFEKDAEERKKKIRKEEGEKREKEQKKEEDRKKEKEKEKRKKEEKKKEKDKEKEKRKWKQREMGEEEEEEGKEKEEEKDTEKEKPKEEEQEGEEEEREKEEEEQEEEDDEQKAKED